MEESSTTMHQLVIELNKCMQNFRILLTYIQYSEAVYQDNTVSFKN